MKEWRYIKPLTTEGLIPEVEGQLGYKFVDSYIDFVKEHNGGRPPIRIFKTSTHKERTIKSFLSFNSGDAENIIRLNRGVAEISTKLVAFAIDDFGNSLCFNKQNDEVVFLDFESEELELVAISFVDFLSMLESGDN